MQRIRALAVACAVLCALSNAQAHDPPVRPKIEAGSDDEEDEGWLQATSPSRITLGANKRTGSGGDAKSKESVSCVTATPPAFIAQSQSKVDNCVASGEQFAQCWMDFSDYKEVQAGIFEPMTACARVHVRSRSGYDNRRKNAKVDGSFTVVSAEGRTKAAPTSQPHSLPDLTVKTPGLYQAAFRPKSISPITIAIPLDSLKGSLEKTLRDSLSKGLGLIRVTHVDFDRFVDGGHELHVSIGVTSPAIKCDPKIQFWIPRSRALELSAQIGRINLDCKEIGVFKLFSLNNLIGEAVSDALQKSINVAGESDLTADKFSEWARKDPLWAALMESAHVQGQYCASPTPALCVKLTFDYEKAVEHHVQMLLQQAPKRSGPVPSRLRQELEKAEAVAQTVRKRSERIADYQYPAAMDGSDKWRDRDVVIYAGLLCLAGEDQGCEAVRRSQSDDLNFILFSYGRMWRSPDLRRDFLDDLKQVDSFSGDQMNGFVAYATAKSDSEAVRRYLKYIARNRVGLPSNSLPVDYGYRFCTDGFLTCLMGGPDWYWMSLLGKRFALEDLIPPLERDVEGRYGFGPAAILLQSIINPQGYRLHLTGIQILLSRRLGVSSPLLDQAAAILASRQPDNPFYLYLHLGRDASVFKAAKAKCDVGLAAAVHEDWAWQNAEADKKWLSSMAWDCVFIYRLLRQPVPTPIHLIKDLRIEIFHTAAKATASEGLASALRMRGAVLLNRRAIDPATCRRLPKVPETASHVIRYDKDNLSEGAALAGIREDVEKTLGLEHGKSVALHATPPTPGYMSVFLCDAL